MKSSFTILTLSIFYNEISQTCSFTSSRRNIFRLHVKRLNLDKEAESDSLTLDKDGFSFEKGSGTSRRQLFSGAATVGSFSIFPFLFTPQQTEAALDSSNALAPSVRATAYLVDSTKPPTLVPISKAREAAILKNLGNGLGTSKKPFVEDEITLNNMMNKGVFGTVDLIRSVVGGKGEGSKTKTVGGNSFIFIGLSTINQKSEDDIHLAAQIITDIIKPRRGLDTAIGLDFAPQSTQEALNTYLKRATTNNDQDDLSTDVRLQDEEELIDVMSKAKVPQKIVESYMPILRLAKKKKLNLLALAPEVNDVKLVRTTGLENLDPEKRLQYVTDTEGFVSLTQDPSFQLYAEKSLLKDFEPVGEKDQPGNYFAERILVHEAVSTKIANYAASRPSCLVVTLAPLKDLRFMGGPNKRITRVMKFIQPDSSIDEDDVTTILLNPSAKETLSLSKFLRLEIGTSPTTIPYQTKVADYLWFSSIPKVNMLPRMMNG